MNRFFGALLDSVLAPLDRLSPTAAVAAAAVLVAVGMLFTFKVTSNQQQIIEVKRRIQAGLFEIRLFKDDLRAILRAQGDILWATLRYVRLSMVPLVWMMVPLALVTAHLQSHYGYEGLNPGDSALMKVKMKPESADQARSLRLEVPSGLHVNTPMVWIPSAREAAWRLTGDRDGTYVLAVALGNARLTKTLQVSSRVGRRSPIRLEPGILNQLLYPSEPPLPADAPISSIAVGYPKASLAFFGWRAHWLLPFILVSLAAALLLGRQFNVSF